VTRLSKPVVVFLDDEGVTVREAFLKHFGISRYNVNVHNRYMCISNLSRYGNRLSQWSVRTSEVNPHFINRDCYKNALVYGESDWIGDSNEYTFTVPPLQYDEQGNILPATVDWINFGYPGDLVIVEKDTNHIVLGDIECQ
jgi:hypothetical protein